MTTEKTGATAERFLPESEVRRVVNDGRNFPFATICTQRAVGEAIEARDPELAELTMKRHIANLIESVSQ